MKEIYFDRAKPVWGCGLDGKWNIHIKLTASIEKHGADILKIATSEFYQLFINGKFVCCGPARAGRGYFRVDEIKLVGLPEKQQNTVEVIIFSYGVENFSNIKQPPFVICEMYKNGKSVTATGGDDFEMYLLTDYERSISRYTFQRGFCEAYICDGAHLPEKIDFRLCEEKRYIKRYAPYPRYERFLPDGFLFRGNVHAEKRQSYIKLQAERVGPELCRQFTPPAVNITNELQELEYTDVSGADGDAVSLSDGEFALCGFSREATGMICFDCVAEADAVLYVTYDEELSGQNTVKPQRLGCNACVKYKLACGEHRLMSFEPASMKYICFSLLSGKVGIENVYITECKHPPVARKTEIEDEEIGLIYTAAEETFRQNAVDIFMDCPSRERAGWLCDSFFHGRGESFFCGENPVEKSFLENFLMEDKFKYLPAGMFPMCYPSEQLNGEYIPNWAMWLMIELADYEKRTGDTDMVRRYEYKALGLVRYFEEYKNADGLLEGLDSWVFVDWSESNNNVRDVSFPSNMMYAYMLDALSGLYHREDWHVKAGKIREKIRELSYDGEFFCDNLLKTDNGYKKSGVCTESCQYYAFFTETATAELYPELWRVLSENFGFHRKNAEKYTHIPPSNAFIGNYIRLELLSRAGLYDRLLQNVREYFGYMAQRTGTLWEQVDDHASMNHGFAAYAAVWIYEAQNRKKLF